jgi:hypothetical protein
MPIGFFCQSFSFDPAISVLVESSPWRQRHREVGGFLFLFGLLSQCSILLVKGEPFVLGAEIFEVALAGLFELCAHCGLDARAPSECDGWFIPRKCISTYL